jgi:hypothetical protein
MTLLPARGSVSHASVIPVRDNQANVRRRTAVVCRAASGIRASGAEFKPLRGLGRPTLTALTNDRGMDIAFLKGRMLNSGVRAHH